MIFYTYNIQNKQNLKRQFVVNVNDSFLWLLHIKTDPKFHHFNYFNVN